MALSLAKMPSGAIVLRFLSYRHTMLGSPGTLFNLLCACFQPRTNLVLENLALSAAYFYPD